MEIAPAVAQVAARPLGVTSAEQVGSSGELQVAARPPRVTSAEQVALSAEPQVAARPLAPTLPRAKETPLSPRRFSLTMTVGQETHEKLRRAQELLGHAIAPGDLAAVLDRALDALIAKLEQRKLAATDKPRRSKVAAAFLPTCGERCVSAMATGARSGARTAGAVRSAATSNTTTKSPWRAAARRRSGTCGCSARPTTSIAPIASSASPSWTRSEGARTPVRGRKRRTPERRVNPSRHRRWARVPTRLRSPT